MQSCTQKESQPSIMKNMKRKTIARNKYTQTDAQQEKMSKKLEVLNNLLDHGLCTDKKLIQQFIDVVIDVNYHAVLLLRSYERKE